MQSSHATHPALHLRDAADAHVVFEAVRRGILPLIKRRIATEERDQLSSGHVYVWEEAEHKGGLERWTDGRRWSQSRMKGDYLFYEEKIETTQEEKEAKAARRANKGMSPLTQSFTPTRRQDRPSKPDGLTKQTYSTHVCFPGSPSPRKWHIVAYFSGNDYMRLPVIENYGCLRDIRVPDGVFFSNKGMIKKTDRYSLGATTSVINPLDAGEAAKPGSYVLRSPTSIPMASDGRDTRSWADARLSGFPDHNDSPTALRRHSDQPCPSLPRLSTIAPLRTVLPPELTLSSHACLEPANRPQSSRRGSQSYIPLSPEDRRALNTFRVVL